MSFEGNDNAIDEISTVGQLVGKRVVFSQLDRDIGGSLWLASLNFVDATAGRHHPVLQRRVGVESF